MMIRLAIAATLRIGSWQGRREDGSLGAGIMRHASEPTLF
jgi:hypothetical protein